MDEKSAKLLTSINESLKVIITNQTMLFCRIKIIEDELQQKNTGMKSVPEHKTGEKAF